MAEVIFFVIVAICIVALFAVEGNRAKELNKLTPSVNALNIARDFAHSCQSMQKRGTGPWPLGQYSHKYQK